MKMTSFCRVASVYNRSIKVAKGRETCCLICFTDWEPRPKF